MQTCERCNAEAQGKYELLDYCAICSKNLCDECMAKGCCGNVPAQSGCEEIMEKEAAEIEKEDECTSQPPDTDPTNSETNGTE